MIVAPVVGYSDQTQWSSENTRGIAGISDRDPAARLAVAASRRAASMIAPRTPPAPGVAGDRLLEKRERARQHHVVGVPEDHVGGFDVRQTEVPRSPERQPLPRADYRRAGKFTDRD